MSIGAVRVRGPYHGPTGYDHHVRAFVRHLVQAGVAVQLEHFRFWSARTLPRDMRDPWFDSLRNQCVDARVHLQFCMPHQVVNRPGMTTVNFTMFEATRVPETWVRAGREYPMTIVPEECSRRAWLASGMPEQLLRTCPLGIDPQLFGLSAEPLPLTDDAGELVASRRVRFLNMSEPVPRKNLTGLLRAWLVATDKADDAILVLKVGGHYAEEFNLIDRWRAGLEVEQQKAFSDAAPVLMLRNLLLSDEDMPRLYASATHYISMSHGEGWDLPMMEAAASGLLLIAPDHSAYQTYLNPSIATLLPSAEVPVDIPEPDASLFEGARWWNPSHDAAVVAIREAIDGRDRSVASPRDFVLGHWTWEHATERLIEILSEVDHS